MRVFFASLLLVVLLSPSMSQASPSIRFDETTFDFGEVAQGQRVVHVFEFVNAGDEDLVVEKVTGS